MTLYYYTLSKKKLSTKRITLCLHVSKEKIVEKNGLEENPIVYY